MIRDQIDHQGRPAESFAMSNTRTNLVREPSNFLHTRWNLLFTSQSEPYQITITVRTGRSDLGRIIHSNPTELDSSEASSPHTSWQFADTSEMCSEFTKVIKICIRAYIPHSIRKPRTHYEKRWQEVWRIKRIKLLSNTSLKNRQITVDARNRYYRITWNFKNKLSRRVRNKVVSCSDCSKLFGQLAKSITHNTGDYQHPIYSWYSNQLQHVYCNCCSL